MLELSFIEKNKAFVTANCAKRGSNVDIDKILFLNSRRRSLVGEADDVRRKIREVSKQLGRTRSDEDVARARDLRQRRDRLVAELRDCEAELQSEMDRVPNILDPRVPIGDDSAAITQRVVGQKPSFEFAPRAHDDIGADLGIIDIKRASQVAGSRFYILKNEGVRLRLALFNLFLDIVAGQGWELVSLPVLAKQESLYVSGYLPFASKDNFRLKDSDLSLVGTSEQAILGMHAGEVLRELPLLYLGDSMCFRTEAGSYGRDTKGIIRVHQFYKLEQLVYCEPAEVEYWHEKCLENEEALLQALEIPYRVVITASSDIAAAGSIKYDTEAWLPSQNRYVEMTSNSNLRDYQTRRGKIRLMRGKGEKAVYPFTISATGFCDRHLVALIENHQNEDGSIRLPERLVKYMGGEPMIRPRSTSASA